MAVEAVQFAWRLVWWLISLCVTKDFLDRQNLQKYLELTKQLGASFVQLLEPKAVGHYEGKPVQLSIAEKQGLSDFYLETQRLPVYNQYPIVLYHEHYKKTLGCRGAGVGNFYIDPWATCMLVRFAGLE
jgi:hypothetical protein